MMKKIFRIICLVILGLVIFYLGMAAGVSGYYNYMQRVGKQQGQRFQAELERPLREDVYGGKTPEETFDMYIAALKKGDLELASKYFVVSKQQQHLERLNERNTNNTLMIFIATVEKIRLNWEKGSRELFKYQKEFIFNDNGKISVVTFELNEWTKVWKIYFL